MFWAMSRYRTSSRVAMAAAAALTLSGLVAVGVTSTQPAAAAPTSTGYQNVRINEITSDGTNRVELYNAGTTAVTLTNWKIETASAAATATKTFVTPAAAISPSASSIAPGGFVTFVTTTSAATQTIAASGGLILFADDGTTIVDRVDWASGSASPAMARCGGDGTGSWVISTPTAPLTATFGTTGATNATACPAVLPASSNVRINEVTSTNPDTIEFFDGGTAGVDMSAWKYVDGDTTHALPLVGAASNLGLPTGSTTIAAGNYTVAVPSSSFPPNFGLSDSGDSVFLVDQFGNTVDSVTFANLQAGNGNAATATSYERCPNGSSTGWFQTSQARTFGGQNGCATGGGPGTPGCLGEQDSGTLQPAGTPLAWPGSQTATVVDNLCAWVTSQDSAGEDMSGLAFDPSVTSPSPLVLWAAQNKNWLWKLTKVGGKWVPDSTWSATGKQLFFTDVANGGQPDTEGLTVGPNGHIYVTSERDNADNTIPKDTILEYDPNAASAVGDPANSLRPIHQYDVTSQFPFLAHTKTDANLGFEGVGFVPDSWLVGNGWIDPLTGRVYNPAMYPLHGSGLYFAGLEKDGTLHVYALNSDPDPAHPSTTGTFVTLGTIPTGQSAVMDVFFDGYTQRLIATCDNTCSETHTFMKITNGVIVPDVVYKNPSSMPINNFEGFAIAPVPPPTPNSPTAPCVGSRETVWSDDGNYGTGPAGGDGTYEHALWSGTFPC